MYNCYFYNSVISLHFLEINLPLQLGWPRRLLYVYILPPSASNRSGLAGNYQTHVLLLIFVIVMQHTHALYILALLWRKSQK